MDTRKKILTLEETRQRIQSLSAVGQVIAVAYGWFDIIRAEHVEALAQVKQGCDSLLVLVRPDRDERPTVLDQSSRVQLVAALGVADSVVLCDEAGQEELLQFLPSAGSVDAEKSVTGSVVDDVLHRHGRK